ncbi:MAG TPA: toll/interleukin-1 receptor domain-containing protein, partial [Bacteroidia bacterium]|nr:toll/interleukin-1 receptor domain-containing protein [Bacteroidia bacterium]
LKVFISYAWESEEFKSTVWELAQWILKEGKGKLEVEIDQKYSITPPPEGWQAWMTKQVKLSDIVLVVCSAKYCRRFEKKEGNKDIGRGVIFEGAIITQEIYNSQLNNTRFYPILHDSGIQSHIPSLLLSWDNNHRFPSGNENILKLLFKENPILEVDLKTAKIIKEEKQNAANQNTQSFIKKKKTVNDEIRVPVKPAIESNQPPYSSAAKPENSKETLLSETSGPEIRNEKKKSHRKIKQYISIVLLFAVGLVSLLIYLNNQSIVTIREKRKIIGIIKNYFSDENYSRFNVEKYCAPHINYKSFSDLTPEELDRKLEKDAQEYMGQSIIVDDSSFDFTKETNGQIVVDFTIQFNCYRKSLAQFQKYSVDEEITFSPGQKIISFKEISNHKDEAYSVTRI